MVGQRFLVPFILVRVQDRQQMKEDQYLEEDKDLLDELDSIGPLSTGLPLEEQKRKIQVIHIKALLRSRKVNKDTENSNVIFVFIIVQFLLTTFQFLYSILSVKKNSLEQWFGIFSLFIIFALMFYFYKLIYKNPK